MTAKNGWDSRADDSLLHDPDSIPPRLLQQLSNPKQYRLDVRLDLVKCWWLFPKSREVVKGVHWVVDIRVRLTEPYENLRCLCIDGAHLAYLVITLLDTGLVDANSVDPESPHTL